MCVVPDIEGLNICVGPDIEGLNWNICVGPGKGLN